VYIGAIGLILTYFYHGTDNTRAIVRNCLNCQAFKSVCPVNIDLPRLIKKVYRLVLDDDAEKPTKNMLVNTVLKNRRLFHAMLKAAATAQKPLMKQSDGFIRHLPFFLKKEHQFRSLPALAETSLRDIWPSVRYRLPNPQYRIALFAGCVVDFVSPEQALAFIKLMLKYNVQVDFPQNQTCCGLPAMMMAEEETAAEIAEQNLEAMQPEKYDYIVTLCASCASHIKESYPILIKGEKWSSGLTRLHDRLIDFSSFLMNVLHVKPDQFEKSGKKIAYHSPCHLCRGLNVIREPRDLLSTAGFTYTPCRDEDVCCGFGGSYSIEFPEISAAILNQKLDYVEETGADVLVTDCPGCVLQLRGGMDKRGCRIQVRHIAEMVAKEMKLG
ncbi:MAG: (Fe-S)-binding protein, partial [Desulfatirhabdiaceae bacterium]